MLRPYQLKSISALYAFLSKRETNPCVVIPTGGGKTHVIAQICKDATTCWGGKSRVLILAHRKELLEQNVEKISMYAEGIDVGVYSAGLKRRDRRGQIIVAGIHSVFRRAEHMGKFDLVIIDEAHLIPPDGDGMYRTFLRKAKELNPALRLVGLTATPYRMTSGWICADTHLLNEICYDVSVHELIADQYLCKLLSKCGIDASLPDLSEVHTRGGEYVPEEVEKAFTDDYEKVRSAISEVITYATDRKKVLIFACGIIHAGMIEKALSEAGCDHANVGHVFGETPGIMRCNVIAEFKRGPLKYLINVNVLTEGFDAPNIDMIVLMRATKSPGLYYQMVGRGLRICDGKENCLVLDFGGNVERHGTVDMVIPAEVSGDGKPVMKACPQCHSIILGGRKQCDCGYIFQNMEEEKELARHNLKASNAEIISSVRVDWYEVVSVSYAMHEKHNAPPGHPKTLRVTYYTTLGKYAEWVCVEHLRGSYANQNALAWWSMRSRAACPRSADKAARLGQEGFLRAPDKIRIMFKDLQIPKVVEADFSRDIPEPPPDREPGEDDPDLLEESTDEEDRVLESLNGDTATWPLTDRKITRHGDLHRDGFMEVMELNEDDIPF